MNIRHINRGNIREGGCPMCKPPMKRWGSWITKGERDVLTEVEEALDEMHECEPYEEYDVA